MKMKRMVVLVGAAAVMLATASVASGHATRWGATPRLAAADIYRDDIEWDNGDATVVEDVTCVGERSSRFRRGGVTYYRHLVCLVEGWDYVTEEDELFYVRYHVTGSGDDDYQLSFIRDA